VGGLDGSPRPYVRLAPGDTGRLVPIIEDAQRLGFVGPGPVVDQVVRSLAFATVAGPPPDELAVDLGSGGGLPGLVLALYWPTSRWLLIDSNQRRASWLEGATKALSMADRVGVICQRAEESGRSQRRAQAQLVTARSFGPPAATAECAAPLLRQGGRLLVADPPETLGARWPAPGLAKLGLELDARETVATAVGPVSVSSFIAVSLCPDLYPRRVGVPFKRLLF
jgi:16S rRNA (guanine527-N7)-methyltransferase